MSDSVIGILSIGDMGLGIARLLRAHGFAVATNATGRSPNTRSRAAAAGVVDVGTDAELVRRCTVILSVVPPRDALATAQRVVAAVQEREEKEKKRDIYFADMNAVAPATVRKMAAMMADVPSLRLIDGCIIGGPPKQSRPTKEAAITPSSLSTSLSTSLSASSVSTSPPASSLPAAPWYRPLMPTSGPYSLDDAVPSLAETLNSRHLGPVVGSASGLKMCFAAMTKGYAAIAVEAFTTAHRLGVLSDLQWAMSTEMTPGRLQQTEAALAGMPPKAYRWVREMEEISATFAVDGGFGGHQEGDGSDRESAGERLFAGAADVFRTVANDTVLGQEVMGQRQRGRTAEDVAVTVAEGLEAKEQRKRGERSE